MADDGTSHSFLRTVCRDCTGAVISVLDTELDGTSPYGLTGTVGRCCETTVLAECTYSLPDIVTGFSLTDPAYPDCWLGTAPSPSYAYGDRVTSWDSGIYLSDTGSASAVSFTSPDLGGAIPFTAFTPALPVNPANSAPAYVGTAVINGVTVTLTATVGNGIAMRTAAGAELLIAGGDGFRLDFSEPVRLTLNTSAFADPPALHERFCGVSAQTVPWPAVKLADCQGVITTVDPDTRAAIPADATLECFGDCPATSVQTVRLCDLDPTVEPDEDGRRCATPFLRHLAYDCAGDLLSFHDTGLDGTTPYTPVQVVDCQCASGDGITSTIEVPWQVVSVVEDPAGLPRQDFIYTVSPENDPSRIGTIRVHVSRQAGAPCAPYDINTLVFSNTAAYTLTLDAVAQEMSYLRVDLVDFDTFEPVAINTAYPLPTRLGGTAGWNAAHNRIVPSENDGTGYLYWDNPPEVVGWSVLNQGGGVSCSMLSFQGMTVEPGGCCGGEQGCTECDPIVLCDIPATGDPVSFLRTVCRDCTGAVLSMTDTELDGTTPYTPTGTVATCAVSTEDSCARQVIERCGCDDTNGDGIAEESYTEVWAVDPCNGGAPVLLGTYLDGDLSQPYTPVAPVDCIGSEVLSGEPVLLCDAGTPFLRHVQYAGDGNPVSSVDTALDGVTPYTVTGTVGSCAGAVSTPDAGVSTGLRRLAAGTSLDVKATWLGLQSASVTVLAGTAQVTTTGAAGPVAVPAGVTLTWSVADTDDTSLDALTVAAAAASDVLINTTYKASASG